MQSSVQYNFYIYREREKIKRKERDGDNHLNETTRSKEKERKSSDKADQKIAIPELLYLGPAEKGRKEKGSRCSLIWSG